jgi:hypothetical protein
VRGRHFGHGYEHLSVIFEALDYDPNKSAPTLAIDSCS